jgi:RNA polymerase sigma factor (sigma-70 family)
VSGWSETIASARTGDPEAFGSLVQHFRDMAIGYAYSILGDFDQSEDAVQSAFIDAYQNLRDLRELRAFPAWLRKIVFKHCDRQTRGRRLPTVSIEQAEERQTDRPDPRALAEQRETQASVLRAIRALPDDERVAATLFYISGYSQAEVAQFLEIPVTTLKNRLHRSRNLLRDGLLDVAGETLKRNIPGCSLEKTVRLRIENLKWVHRWLTHLGCLEGCARYLGLDVSPSWLSGGAGYAFAMRVHAELCPAGIIAWAPPAELARNVGFETELLAPGDDEVSEQQRIVWGAANKALEQGMPCIGFAMEAWQSYIIYGYDEDGYFYEPVRTGDGRFPRQKMGVEVPCVMTFIKRTDQQDDVSVVREALSFAVRYSMNPDIAPGWGGAPEEFVGGLDAYSQWISAIESGRADAHGLGFNAQVYAELRHLAVGFLREAATRLGTPTAFGDAILQYESVAASLEAVARLYPLPAEPETVNDDDRRREAIALLQCTRSAEQGGVEKLQHLLGVL